MWGNLPLIADATTIDGLLEKNFGNRSIQNVFQDLTFCRKYAKEKAQLRSSVAGRVNKAEDRLFNSLSSYLTDVCDRFAHQVEEYAAAHESSTAVYAKLAHDYGDLLYNMSVLYGALPVIADATTIESLLEETFGNRSIQNVFQDLIFCRRYAKEKAQLRSSVAGRVNKAEDRLFNSLSSYLAAVCDRFAYQVEEYAAA